MGVPELVTAMQEVLRQAEAQLAHVPVLDRSRDAWRAVADRLGDVSEQLRHSAAAVSATWPDDVGTRCSERMDGSATTVRDWRETLAAANLPEVVTALAAAVKTTVDGIRQLWDVFTQTLGQLAVAGVDPGAVEEALAALVSRARAMLGELDQQFADAAERVSGAAAGTPWDGPGTGTDQPASTMAATAPAGGAGADPGAAPEPGGGGTGAGPSAAPTPARPGASPVPSPVLPSTLTPASSDPSLAPGLAGASPSLSPSSPPLSGGGISPAGIPATGGLPGGIGPIVGGTGIGAAIPRAGAGGAIPRTGAGGAIPRAGRHLSGAVPTATATTPATGVATGGTTTGRAAGGRFVPPLYGTGLHGRGGGHHGEAKPGEEASAHRTRPIRDMPGVPPELRGRTAPLDATPRVSHRTARPGRGARPDP